MERPGTRLVIARHRASPTPGSALGHRLVDDGHSGPRRTGLPHWYRNSLVQERLDADYNCGRVRPAAQVGQLRSAARGADRCTMAGRYQIAGGLPPAEG